MIRAVFDTNIVVSAQFWDGPPRQALLRVEQGNVTLLTSEVLVNELRKVLSRTKFNERLKNINKTASQLVEAHLSVVEIVQPADISPAIAADPTDNAVLACAIGGKADYIVSGDAHLLNLSEYHNIPIRDVSTFLALLDDK